MFFTYVNMNYGYIYETTDEANREYHAGEDIAVMYYSKLDNEWHTITQWTHNK